ncbi:o-succinylbenzoate synthase [Bombilactobacillus bombi]|uniref:o-succinylbenzoate synthase n=1 Tax=Bombilactobacillus bombi TaxID=1303590 RepID=UPI0015E5FB79|nr:o-succinylbenzoate synthase [Bombilactobacillus bombi]MBA1433718.1 o-succinylbenzoate synthase [Bombilactobacillus bombi]
MQIKSLKLLPVSLTFKQPFVSAHETLSQRNLLLVQVVDELGNQGLGELEAFEQPYYSSETLVGAKKIIEHTLAPTLTNFCFDNPCQIQTLWQKVRGNNFAQAAVETAIWAAFAQRQQQPLRTIIAQSAGSSTNSSIHTGISLGLSDLKTTTNQVQQALNQGYQKIKIKINGNADLKRLASIRQRFIHAPLMADANGSLTLTPDLASNIDQLNLIMIEDPFGPQDLRNSHILQKQMSTPICFDEPITSVAAALNALYFQQCQIISCKISALGGITPVIQLIQAQRQYHFPLWCGAMLEGGIGRALNLAVASLNNFNFPSDIAETKRYYQKDLTQEKFELQEGKIILPTATGLGVQLLPSYQKQLHNLPSLI